MKTAISVPDETFDEAERRAAALGMSRSEFFTTAARDYIRELDAQSLTGRSTPLSLSLVPMSRPRPPSALAGVPWLTGTTALATMPGNVFLPAAVTRLQRDSVVNVTARVTLSKDDLGRAVGAVPDSLMRGVDQGLRQVLAL